MNFHRSENAGWRPREVGATQGKLRLDPISITGPGSIASPVRIRRKHLPEPNPDRSRDFSPPRDR